MKAKRTNPVLNRPNQGKDSREFLKNLEELMRRDKGGFGAIAFDAGTNRPYKVGGKVLQPNQNTPSIQWRPGSLRQPQEVPVSQFPELNFEPQGEVLGDYTLPENPTPNEMLDAIFREAWSPQLPTSEQLEDRYRQTGEVYPVMSNQDGTVTYNDGSIRAIDQSKPPMPIASMQDGTVLWTDGFTRQMPPGGLSQYLAGVSGLSQFIFSQDQTVTQGFGNSNPMYESGYHQGVDFRTRDLQQRNLFTPVPMRVVQIITEDSGSPYGNSVLLELPSGEMLRLSHLSTLGEFTEGQVLNPGELIGVPGSTGRSTGEHLDVEFYNQQGQLDNPNNFKSNVSSYSIANEITGVSPYNQPNTQQTNTSVPSVAEAPKQAVQAIGNTGANIIDNANLTGNLGVGASELLRGDVKGAQTELSNTINTLNPTGKFDLGLTEGFNTPQAEQARLNTVMTESAGQTNPLRYLAGNVVEKIGDTLGIPEGAGSEIIAGTQTRRTNTVNASDGNYQALPQSPFANDGYAPNLTGDAQRAIDYTKEQAGNAIQNIGQDLRAKAGQGIEVLKQAGSGIKNLIGKGLETLTPRREVGEQSSQVAQEVGKSAQMSSIAPKNDIRDPFFKMGGAQLYSKYVAPDAEQKAGGALTLDLFSPDFFSNADNVANVFGSTYMGKEATDKFRSSEAKKYPLSSFSPIGYGEGEWSSDYRSAVDRYNQEGRSQTDKYNKSITDYLGNIPSVLKGAFSFTEPEKPTSQRLTFGTRKVDDKNMSYAPQMSFARPQEPQMSKAQLPQAPQMSFARNMPQMSIAPKPSLVAPQAPKRQLSLQDYLNMGKSREQWFAETGQQSTMDQMKRSGQWNDAGKQMSVGPQQGVTNAIKAASSGSVYTSPSGNRIQNFTPANANMTDASTGLPVVGKVAPYPIATMADGRKRYSDGSIR